MRHKSINILILLLIALASASHALEYSTTNNFTLAEDQTLASEHWIYTQTGRVDGVVQSDIFMLGQNIDLTGSFSNDIWAVGTKVEFSGIARDQVRLAGQVVTVSNKPLGGLSIVAETIKCADSTECQGDLFLAGSDIIFEGKCDGNARIIGNRVTVRGNFDKNLRIIASDIVIANETRIAGDLIYTAPKELYLQDEVTLGGELVRTKATTAKKMSWNQISSILITQALWFLASVLVGIPFIALFPPLVVDSVQSIRNSTWKSLLIGLGALILTPLFAAIIFGSIVGIPLALILLACYGTLLYLAKYPVALLLGSLILRIKVARTFKDILLLLVTGLAAIYILISIPMLGGTIHLIIIVYGVGALLNAIIIRRNWSIASRIERPEPPPVNKKRNKDTFSVVDESKNQ